jgi:CO/xanthine dehydrogenase Mo-binding subunit
VVAVLTAADMDDIPPGGGRPTTEPLLATDRVRYVGEAVAIVVTEQGYQGQDAAELVSVDYDPLPAVVDFDDALAGGTLLFDGTDSNVIRTGGEPAPPGAFDRCEVVVERTFPNQRLAPLPLEGRAAAARWADGRLTLWASTQNAQLARDAVAAAVGLDAAGYEELRAEQARRREAGGPVQLGIGLATYVEITAGDGGGETSRVVVDATGAATVYTGSSPHGQGHQTAFAMLVTDQLGIPMDKITVIHGDTDQVPIGIGTFGSRSLQLGGTAVHQATLQVKNQAREVTAGMIEASEADLELDTATGTWQVRGDPDTALSWAEVAAQAGPAGLAADVEFRADSPTFPFGAHLALVEVDTQTGKATLIRHVTVDDAGKVLNPVLAEGQRHGGIAQGAAQALLEEMRYDPEGNPLTSTLADYAAITATELPSFELLAMETPTSVNALGVKGIGEAGTIGATPAVHNAVIDAVAHLGVRHIDMPATPQRVWAAINEAKGSA